MSKIQESGDEKPAVIIFIIPHKIQKRRLEDMKMSMQKKDMVHVPMFTETVTHVVTAYDDLQQVDQYFEKSGIVCAREVPVVNILWLTDCLKASKIVTVQSVHRLQKHHNVASSQVNVKQNDQASLTPLEEWACQRGARLDHFNKNITNALEILQEHAELRDDAQDYSRALAFRRASCVLKSLPFTIQSIDQIDGRKDIGGHVRRVIADILDHGSSTEVENIRSSEWFKRMKLFSSIFGVGPSTAKKWIERGFETLEDVKENQKAIGSDWRVLWGLAFHQHLIFPVSKTEALAFTSIVREEAEKIMPGTIVELTGGFRRGKSFGHDVDILLTHPYEGAEIGILPRLLDALENKGLVLIGSKEKNSFRPEVLYQDYKLTMRGQLDHFEKWLGICKFPKHFRLKSGEDETVGDEAGSPRGGAICKTLHQSSTSQVQPSAKHADDVAAAKEGRSCFVGKKAELTAYIAQKSSSGGKAEHLDESLEENYEPSKKKQQLHHSDDASPFVLADTKTDWYARRVDLIVSPFSQFYYALVGWTGSKHFNRDARLYAQKIHGLKLTSHGLYDLKKQELIPAKSEEEVFSHLHLPYRDAADRNC